jgi:hypothetical protein
MSYPTLAKASIVAAAEVDPSVVHLDLVVHYALLHHNLLAVHLADILLVVVLHNPGEAVVRVAVPGNHIRAHFRSRLAGRVHNHHVQNPHIFGWSIPLAPGLDTLPQVEVLVVEAVAG